MATSKKEKSSSSSRGRRHSHDVVISHGRKSKKKDTDTESITSSTASSADTVVAREPRKCPLRFMLTGIIEAQPEEKKGECPLRRVQLWHTIPLCLLAIVNLLLVIIALLGLAGYRISMGVQAFVLSFATLETSKDTVAVQKG